MKDTLCFVIEEKHLYLDKVLVELNFPMLFVCTDEEQMYYMAMCIDAYKLTYLIRKCEGTEISDMILGKITLKDFWRKSNECWKIYTGNEMSEDKVFQVKTSEIDDSDLPEEGRNYIIENGDIKCYALCMQKDIYTSKIQINASFSVQTSVYTAVPISVDFEDSGSFGMNIHEDALKPFSLKRTWEDCSNEKILRPVA